MTRPSVILRAEDRFHIGLIVRLYRLVLNRNVDMSGLASSLQALRRGTPLSTIVANTLKSDEFTSRNTTSVETVDDVDGLFRAAFGRPPPPLGVAARVLSAAAYAAELLTDEERGAPSRITSAIFPDGIDPGDDVAYRFWIEDHHTPDAPRRAAISAACAKLPAGIAVSLVLIGGTVRQREIAETVASVRSQFCDRFELIVVGGGGFCAAVAGLAPAAVTLTLESRDFAVAFNAALARCRGAFVGVLEPGTRLSPDAVFHVAASQATDRTHDVAALLTDYDRIDRTGRRFAPQFSTGWDPDAALCRVDWGRHMLLRTSIARAIGGARSTYKGYEQHDLALRVIDAAGRHQVHHIARPLYSVPADTWIGRLRRALAARADARSWSRLVIDRLTRRSDIAARRPRIAAQRGGVPSRLVYPLPRQKPLVSIIIPTRDKPDLLRPCIDGLLRRTDYPALEILVIDNRSQDPLTHAYFAELAVLPNVRLLASDRDFNWGAINNYGVSASKGEIVLLLNNDTEVVHPDWLTEIAAQAMRPEVGAVGAKLLYRDGTVQHAGLVLGPDGHSFHRFRHLPGNAGGYRDALAMVRNVSAVTGACLAIRRSVFDEVGGIEEQALAVTWSDVDLCLRVQERGYRVICTPFARMLHVELATRGADDTPERAARAERERRFMMTRWPRLATDDVFFNPNFQLGEGDTLLASCPRLHDSLAQDDIATVSDSTVNAQEFSPPDSMTREYRG